MEERIIDKLVLNSKKQIRWAEKFKKKRYLFDELKTIDKEYFIGVKGIRGVGKTVLMLQLAGETRNSVYFSADSTLARPFSIYEIVKEFRKRGLNNIFIDEIHRKPDWDLDVKSLFDEHETRIIFSGSSALDVTKTGADLSRRVVLKELKPVSFREFLNIKKGYGIPSFSFNQIIKSKRALVNKYAEVYEYLNEYFKYGGVLYPKNGFFEALENSMRKVILQDLSALRSINIKYEADVYKLLYLIARSGPFEVNYSSIARALEVSKTMSVRIVNDLEKTGMILVVFPCKKKGINLKKEPKIYLAIPLRHFFAEQGVEINKGASREEFFVNHARKVCYLKRERGQKTPDFRFEDKVIEIGGESKKAYQNPDYIAANGLSTAKNKIPLFLTGFLY